MIRLYLFLLLSFAAAACGPVPSDNQSRGEGTLAQSDSVVWFEETTDQAGLGQFRHRTGASGKKWMPESFGSGGGFIDYNGDNWQDILLVGGGVWPHQADEEVAAVRLYRNEGGGSFVDVTQKVGLNGVRAYGMGVTVADYDNDGDDDFYLTTLSSNLLFRNEGGRYSEVADYAGVGGSDVWSTCSIFFDADRDGYLDLYVCNYVDWSPETDLFCTPDGTTKVYCTPQQYEGMHGRFYLNQGDGTFIDRTSKAGFADAPGKSLGVAGLDYNRDGWTDLVVANDTQRDLLFENRGDGTFEEKGMKSGIAYDDTGTATGGMGVDVGVIDTTGHQTIVIGNFAKEAIGVFQYQTGGMFRYRSSVSRIGHPSLTTLAFGLFLFDFDLDTDLDLFVANGHVQPLMAKRQEAISYRQAPQLFVNRGDGTFEEGVSAGALSQKYVARGAAHADIDRDGDLDVLITENGGPAHLLINRRISGDIDHSGGSRDLSARDEPGFLRVSLKGTESNVDGAGARIVASVNGRTSQRYVQTGSSYLSASEKTVTFGLADAEQVDELIIRWPSGLESRFHDVAANQHVQITEGRDTYRQVTTEDALSYSIDS